MRIANLVLFSLLLAATAFARRVEFHPAAPTSATPVRVEIWSDPNDCWINPTIAREGRRFTLTLRSPEVCVAVGGAVAMATADLGLLEPGEYELVVNDPRRGAPVRYLETKFVVRNGATPPFTVVPFAIPTYTVPATTTGTPLVLHNAPAAQFCTTLACSNVRVFFGDTPMQPRIENGSLVVTAPARPAGLVDVRIVADDRPLTMTSPAAAYFFDRTAPPDPTVFEPVLFPVLAEVPGAHGSRWATETTILNRNRHFVETWNRVDSIRCIDFPCTERLAPGQELHFRGGNGPRGATLFVPRDAAPELFFGSRVRDLSRESEDFGAELPVVRESRMTEGRVELLDIPARAPYRAKLRVYSFGATPGTEASVVLTGGNDTRLFRVPMLQADPSCAACTSGELDLDALDLPQAMRDRVHAQIFPVGLAPTWAFVSVTNNTTQRVTTITPNH